MEQKYSGLKPDGNSYAIQLYFRIHKINRKQAAYCQPIQANMAMAKPKNICHRRNCRGTRGTANHLWSQCIFNPLNQQQQNFYQPNSGKPYPDGRIRGQFRGYSRGKNYPGTNNINSNNILNSGQNPSGIRYGNQ